MLDGKIIVKHIVLKREIPLLLLTLPCEVQRLFITHLQRRSESLASPHTHSDLCLSSALCGIAMWIT